MKQLRQDFKTMTPYERYKLKVDFLRFLATMAAPIMIVVFTRIAKLFLGW
jgi:hypothetical protein